MKIVPMIVGLTVSVIVLAVLLVPMAQEDTYKVFANNTVGYSGTIADSTEDIDLDISVSDRVVTINDITYTYSVNDVVMFTEDSMLLSTTVSPYISFNYVLNGTKVVNANLSAIELTASEGTITATMTSSANVESTVTLDYDWICYRDNSGDDRIFNVVTSSKTVYYDDSNPIYAVASADGGYVSFVNSEAELLDTEYEATLNGETYRGEVKEATLSYQQANSDLYLDRSGTVTCPFYAAVSGTLDCSTETENTAYSLLPVIPVFIVLAILVSAVGLVMRRD